MNRKPPVPAEDRPVMNEEIRASQVRVVVATVGGKDEALGIMSRAEAMERARALGGLDLILINDKSDPPVCKIVDYSKYRYMQEKKAKEIKKNSKASELKEVKMSYKIDVHDYDVRKKSASKFILQGDRVKATVMFRGREVQHDKLGFELLAKLSEDLDDICVTEGKPKREGRNLSLILGPRAEVLKAVNENRKKQEKLKKLKKKEALEGRPTTKIPGGTAALTAVGALAEGDEAMAMNEIDNIDEDDEEEEEAEDDYDDEDEDDDDDDDDASLDELLGSDKLVDDLFSSKQ